MRPLACLLVTNADAALMQLSFRARLRASARAPLDAEPMAIAILLAESAGGVTLQGLTLAFAALALDWLALTFALGWLAFGRGLVSGEPGPVNGLLPSLLARALCPLEESLFARNR